VDGCPSLLEGYCRAEPAACFHSKKKYVVFCVSVTGNRAWKVSSTQGILLVSLCRKFKPGWCEHNTSTKRFCLHRTGSHVSVLFVLVNQPYVLFLFQKHWSRWQYSNSSRSKHCLIFLKMHKKSLLFFFCQCQATGVSSWHCRSIYDEALGVILYRWT